MLPRSSPAAGVDSLSGDGRAELIRVGVHPERRRMMTCPGKNYRQFTKWQNSGNIRFIYALYCMGFNLSREKKTWAFYDVPYYAE